MGIKYTITYGSQSKEITDANNDSFTLSYGSRSESIAAGSGKTLSCAVNKMNANLTVGSHTLSCSGKIMNNNVVISSQSYIPNVTLTILGNGKSEASVKVNGNSYSSAATLSLPIGTIVELNVWGTWITPGRIYVNGNQVASGSSQSYSVTLTGNATADFNGSSGVSGRIYFSM